MVDNKSPSKAAEPTAGWAPTRDAKSKATMFRWISGGLWGCAIAIEAVAIFWVLRQREPVGESGALVRDVDTGLLREQAQNARLPQSAFIALLVMLVVIAVLSITGSILWKRANRLDPARKSETFRFFVQNQLGAIVAVVAFLPLIILIFLNKDMDKGQKTAAGAVGVALAILATVIGVDFNPPSVEQYTADQSTVIQLLGKDEVVWVDGGSVYHVCDQVADVQTGSEKRSGTTAEAIEAGKTRLTLKFASELKACGLAIPENAAAIVDSLREIQSGQTDTPLPAPVWADPLDGPPPVEDSATS